MSERPLRILLLEDSVTDAVLTWRALRKSGLVFELHQEATREDFLGALDAFQPDIALLDYHLHAFNGLEALRLVRQTHPEVPVVMVTGSLGDETVADLLKAGARDYVLKDHLVRLPHAVQYALAAEQDIRARKAAEAQVQHLNRVLRTISACNQDLVHAQCEADLLQAICRDVVEVGGYLLAWAALPDADGRLVTRTWQGDEALLRLHEELERDPDHHRACLMQRAWREHGVILDNAVREEDECHFTRLHSLGVEAILTLPLVANGQALGVLTVFSGNANPFDAREQKLMEELAADLAYGITALRTAAERDRGLALAARAMRQTVTAIARTLEMRDPYTAGHQQRVTELAVAIAGELGWGERQVEGLQFAGMIHDLGKIAVPAEILAKPTHLSELEYRLVQVHAETGYQIIKDIEFPWPVAEMIRQHHERLDGSGYPQGLTGEAILPEARILAVADVVEAMSSHRPYRPGLGLEAALAEITHGRGTLFDPQAVEACLRLFREGRFVWAEPGK